MLGGLKHTNIANLPFFLPFFLELMNPPFVLLELPFLMDWYLYISPPRLLEQSFPGIACVPFFAGTIFGAS